MGHIYRFDIKNIIETFNTKTFIETGTGEGVSLRHALQFDFDKIYTIEMVEELYNRTKRVFNDEKINFVLNNSKEGLIEILKDFNKDENILFWLDAHFPGADFGLCSYADEKNDKIRIPLESELIAISSIRDCSKDYFIIDDLRIYEDGNFEGGNWSDRKTLGADGIDFIHNLFSKTHSIIKDYRDQGYIILIPLQ
jgi:hypothetical protein